MVSSRDSIKFKCELGPRCNHQKQKVFNSIHLSWKLSPFHQTKDVRVLGPFKASRQELAIQGATETMALLRSTLMSASEFTSELSSRLLSPPAPLLPPSCAELKRTLSPLHALPLTIPGSEKLEMKHKAICRLVLITWNRWCGKCQVRAISTFFRMFLKMQKQQRN